MHAFGHQGNQTIVSVQIHHYRWALDWPKQWVSSVHVRGGAGIDASPETAVTHKQFLFHIKTNK